MTLFSKSEENRNRFILLLYDVGTKAVRNKFELEFSPDTLKSTLNKNHGKLQDLKRRKIISVSQWHKIYPRNGDPKAEKFDTSLMICLLSNLAGTPVSTALPFEQDFSVAADLGRIKYYRNQVAHYVANDFTSENFELLWSTISKTICRLSKDTLSKEVEDVRTLNLTVRNNEIDFEIEKCIQELHKCKTKAKELVEEARILSEGQPVSSNIKEQFRLLLNDWNEKDKKFVTTRASQQIIKTIKQRAFQVIIGGPGVGKTVTMRNVAIRLKEDGFDIIPVASASDIINYHNKTNQKTLFIVDDFCGRYTLDEDEHYEWNQAFENVDKQINENCKLLIACRLQIFQDNRFCVKYVKEGPVCYLQSSEYILNESERSAIARKHKIGTEVAKKYAGEYYCFPLICASYNESNMPSVTEYFDNPYRYIFEEELDYLYCEVESKFSCLALLVMFNNHLERNYLQTEGMKETEASSRVKTTLEACKVSKDYSIKNELDSLLGTFVKCEEGIYKAIDAKMFDFLVYYVANRLTSFFIENADSCLVHERCMFVNPNAAKDLYTLSCDIFGTCSYVLYKDAKWLKLGGYVIIISPLFEKIYFGKMISDWLKGKVDSVMGNGNMYCKQFFTYLCDLDLSTKKDLAQKKDDASGHSTVFALVWVSQGPNCYIDWMLHYGANVNALVKSGCSPLYLASCRNQIDSVNSLLSAGADINVSFAEGTPLFGACFEGNKDIVEVLLEKKADVNLSSYCGSTPLHIASFNGFKEIVELLLKHKANANQLNKEGRSPLQMAEYNNHQDIVEILKKHDFSRKDLIDMLMIILVILPIIIIEVFSDIEN